MTITYFITGANRGIGFELAKQLSADSNNIVFATTRSLANATALQDLNRSNLHIIEYDVTSPLETMKKALVEPFEKYSPNGVDVIILNAGIAKDAVRSILQTTEADLEEHYAVNAIGPVKVYQSLFPYWSKKVNAETAKKLILVSSGAGFVHNYYPFPTSHYGPSKAALNHISRHIAFDHTSSELDHIKNSIVVPINPGIVVTNMSEEAVKTFDFEKFSLKLITPEESASSIIKLINGLEQKDNDTFISYDGTRYSW
ncbi:NAD(P)-binding protein [Hyphopichia burtonii NRRL Y-1933]|uniref:NAD(P)-binding protein n=1 Tax=Hyphopichia burtonii NRRL Y-1933 TaxID=984485 RepID=A0A1E4RML3_9ASCO|nr:NAD(P)-binding protein [Hyphopichia burtonii NRRL Y-1933]ODV68514.1 NAD(P)-binding protein [Hyphopichia burtonii NRRL Y-1933]